MCISCQVEKKIPYNYDEFLNALEISNYSFDKEYVAHLLDTWAIKKYPIWKKFGEKLILTKEQVDDLGISESEAVEDFLSKKDTGDDFHGLIYSFIRSNNNSEIAKSLVNNIAFNEDVLRSFLMNTFDFSILKIISLEKDLKKAMQQTKLTKQLRAAIQGVIEFSKKNFPPGASVYYAIEKWEKILPYLTDRLSEYTQLAKEKQAIKASISIHPLDFLTASYNDHGWSSCLSPEGENFKSTFSFMTDDATMVGYIHSRRVVALTYPDKSWVSKKFRLFMHFDEKKRSIAFNKIYPYDKVGLSKMFKMFISEQGLVKDTVIGGKEDRGVYFVQSDSSYMDLGSRADGVFENYPVSETPVFQVGGDVGCMLCGNLNHFEVSDWECESCGDYFYCGGCGDKVYGHSYDGLCEYCVESCSECGSIDDQIYHNNFGEKLCENCLVDIINNSENQEEAKGVATEFGFPFGDD